MLEEVDGKGPAWVQLARDDVVETLKRWHELKQRHREVHVPEEHVFDDPELVIMVDRLVGSTIMLLRAVEEIEARPWWKRRRHNPYAH